MDSYFWPWIVCIIIIGLLLLFTIALVVILAVTLKRVNGLMEDVQSKMSKVDPLFDIVHEVGLALENYAIAFKRFSEKTEHYFSSKKKEFEEELEERKGSFMDAAAWITQGLLLIKKFRERRK